MTDDPIPSLAEAMAEIRRLREQLDELKGLMRQSVEIWRTENDRALARVAELEIAAAMQRGTLAQPSDDSPATITHGHAPSAPPHNE